MKVTTKQRTLWGSYSDRKNSFDDAADINSFIKLVDTNSDLKEYIGSFLPEGLFKWKPHAFGEYGVDLTLMDSNKNPVLDIDVERWSVWKEEWPQHYRCLHFLGRKDKFLKSDRPFFMVFLNFPRTECIILEKETLEKYPTKTKFFKIKNIHDDVKEIPLFEGKKFK